MSKTEQAVSVSQKNFNVNSLPAVKLAIDNAIAQAIGMQKQGGYWVGTLDSNATMEAEYILLLHFLEIHEPETYQKLAKQILNQQQTDGSWGQYYQGPGDISSTVECYFALKLAGFSADHPQMKIARSFIELKGGITKVRVFTKIWLALFGQWSWYTIPPLLPELVLLPNWFPINIYEFASWARATIVPLTLIMTEKPFRPIPEAAKLKELFPEGFQPESTKMPRPKPFLGWRGAFWSFDKIVRLYEKSPIKPFRNFARRKVLNWIVSHQDADGSWGGIQPPWVYSLMALKVSGFDLDHPVMKKGLEGFKGFTVETNDSMQLQACVSPVWDTCLMMIALQDCGLEANHPVLQEACRWLINKQIIKNGDWQVKNPDTPPGGWAFEHYNIHYPDIDDSAEVLIAIKRTQLPTSEIARQEEAIKRGVTWLVSMQSKDGGWAAFDKNNENYFLTKIPFFDFGETLDPPCVDVTAHVIEALGRLGHDRQDPVIQKGLDYIYSEQEQNGSWFGRWGVNYIYGLGSVLPALEAIGEDLQTPPIKAGMEWLISKQNSDGGWGESCASYVDPTQHGAGPSTASQTGWALIALMAAGYWNHDATVRGIAYLCEAMNKLGTWDEPYYTGCGFPGYGVGKRLKHLPKPGQTGFQGTELPNGFMINYHLYRHYWPMMALGRYYRFQQGLIRNSTAD